MRSGPLRADGRWKPFAHSATAARFTLPESGTIPTDVRNLRAYRRLGDSGSRRQPGRTVRRRRPGTVLGDGGESRCGADGRGGDVPAPRRQPRGAAPRLAGRIALHVSRPPAGVGEVRGASRVPTGLTATARGEPIDPAGTKSTTR